MDLRAAAIAANRFGFGARPGEIRSIAADPRGWLKAQLGPESAPPAQLAALPAAEDDLLAFARWLVSRRLLNGRASPQLMRRAERMGVGGQTMQDVSIEQSFVQNFRGRYETAVQARLEAAATAARPVFERQAHFWANHFTVSAAKPAAIALPPSFERDAIRPYVGRRFADMLQASTRHPGMLVYLDNWQSIGPNSLWAKNPMARPRGPGLAQAKGLNENLGRELLELHTLGVNGGYTQADVQSLAKIITGWMYERPRPQTLFNNLPATRSGAQLFVFEGGAHEPGAQVLLGKSYAQNGEAQGTAALNDLARHPSTARFIATKLVRHYIADDPPAAAVDRVAAAFKRSDGDLKTAMEAVIDSPEAWAEPFQKFKQPEEYAISFLRALNVQTLPPGVGAAALSLMGQPVYRAAGPDGWSDRAASWLNADLVWKRIEWAEAAAQRIARADIDPVLIGESALGPLMSADTRDAIRRAQSPMQGLSILLACSEFQRR